MRPCGTSPGTASDAGDGPTGHLPSAADHHPAPEHRVYPYLLKGVATERPNHVWSADITYIPVQRSFLYLVAVMDRAGAHLGRLAQGGSAAYAALPEQAAGPAHRRAEPALRGTGRPHRRRHRTGHGGRDLRGRRRDRAGRFPGRCRPGDAVQTSRRWGRHGTGRDRAPRQGGADIRRRRARDRPGDRPRPGLDGQCQVEPRRRHASGAVAHVRRRRRAGARPAAASRSAGFDGKGRTRRLELAEGRRSRMAQALGRGDRRPPALPGIAVLASGRPVAAGLGSPACREHAGAPSPDPRRRSADRARARCRAGPRRAFGLRSGGRSGHDRRRSLRGGHGTRHRARARQWLAPCKAAHHFTRPLQSQKWNRQPT